MPRIPLPFVGPAYQTRTSRLDAQRCVNLYPELDESPTQGKGRAVAGLFRTPGLIEIQTFTGQGGIRGMHRTSRKSRPFVVQGDKLFELTSLTTRIERGTLIGNTSPVSMDDNGLQLCIVADKRGFILTLDTNVLEEITDPDFLGADTVAFIDGFFAFNRPNTDQFFISNLFDGLTYLGSDFFSAESSPDKLVAVHRDHRELWLFGESTIEVWFNAGGLSQPFQRIQNAYIEEGVVNPFCIVSLDNSIYWVTRNTQGHGVVWRVDGYTPVRISTHAIEFALNMTDLPGITAYGYQEEGHWFYVITTLTHTWVYDATSQLWHERAGLDSNGQTTPHPAWNHMFAFNEHLFGDRSSGRLYRSSLDAFDNAGSPLPRIRVSPYVTTQREEMFHERLELDLEIGVGLSDGTTPQTNPQVWMDFSDDHARTFSTARLASIGKQGEFATRAIWRRLGRSRDRVYRVTITDPVPVNIVGAFLEVRL